MSQLDLTKPVTMRDGTPVEIHCTDLGGEYPVLGTFMRAGVKNHNRWTLDGLDTIFQKTETNHRDLINVPAEPKWRAWTEEEASQFIGVVIRSTRGLGKSLLTAVLHGLAWGGYWDNQRSVSFQELLEHGEYTTDLFKPAAEQKWHRCGVQI